MAVSIPRNTTASRGRASHLDSGDGDGGSDYGSDFSAGEEQLVDEILAGLVSSDVATPGIAYHATTTTGTAVKSTRRSHNEQYHTSLEASARSQRSSIPAGNPVSTTGFAQVLSADDDDDGDEDNGADGHESTSTELRVARRAASSDSVEYPDLSLALSGLQPESESESKSASASASKSEPGTQPARHQLSTPSAREKGADTRTPLQRFRSFPKRPLTVTDMAAGAWCELQHWYTLSRLPGGKKTITPAMRGGSRIHQTLEDEVHSTVRVTIASREEAFALRLWNIIQGVRTLRDTGITRELEVWGTVQGEVLNGVIDQLNHESPNASFEQELNMASADDVSTLQPSITDYMASSHKTVYLTDVKTRGSERLPTGIALRPARVQLFLYHRLLSNMADDKLDYAAVFQRYGLDGDARFSDAFIAQIGGLHDEIFYDADSDVEEGPPEMYPPDLIGYRSLSQIIPLVRAELRETFPRGSASISNLLAVQYRHRDDGHIIGNNSFPNDPEALDAYMKDNLRWWRGEREPMGVAIEETYKCGWCEFAETCQWRKDKEAEFLRRKRRGRADADDVQNNS
ncbi:hypothetical protein F5Y14DRAFT_451687 [Nemania sp. NC0429]|nr:hypothetical protein F5Y14DRAFT_451687 [Nemania sp. NC0429]